MTPASDLLALEAGRARRCRAIAADDARRDRPWRVVLGMIVGFGTLMFGLLLIELALGTVTP